MEENNQDLNKKNEVSSQSNFDYWKPVMFFYVKTTSWIIIPLVLGALAGKYVSKSVGSQVLFFVFVILGFLVTCWGIYREIKQYKKSLDKK
ncbi:MAG: AtpZ/AtpI family protein [bacterium]